MRKIVVIMMLICCAGFVFVQPVLATNADGVENVQSELMLNINEADQDALRTLPGVGTVTADRIVVFRSENGPFNSVDELTLVKGIGKKKLEKIRPYVTI